MGNKPSTTTTQQTQTRSPWDPAVPALNKALGSAQGIANNPDNFAPTFSDQTRSAVQGFSNAAASGSDAYGAMKPIVEGSGRGFGTGLGQLSSVAGGDFVNGNPYLDAAMQRSLRDTTDRVNSQFTAAGRYGSGAHAGSLTRALGDVESNARMGEYNRERDLQDNAARTLYQGGFQGAGMGGALDSAKLWAPGVQLQAGQLQDQMDNAARTAPMQAAQWLSGMATPMAGLGGTSNNTTDQQTVQPVNRMGQILGGAQMGLGLMTGNPMMAMGGAGGLFGGSSGGAGATPNYLFNPFGGRA